MIAIDTGPVVAIFDRDDKYHRTCVEILKGIREPLITTWPVLTEAFYLLNFSSGVQDDLWEFIQRGGIKIETIDTDNYSRCRQLMNKYHDLPIDLADATLVAMTEEMNILTVFTLDHKDFSVFRPRHKKHFTLLPSHL